MLILLKPYLLPKEIKNRKEKMPSKGPDSVNQKLMKIKGKDKK